MLSSKRLQMVSGVAAPLLFWVAHLSLPFFERSNPQPGWTQILLIFFPGGWLLLLSHALFLLAIGLVSFQRFTRALPVSLGAAALLLLFRPGPISYSGIQSLWAAYVLVIVSAAIGLTSSRCSQRPTAR